jgi:hypothetical protein
MAKIYTPRGYVGKIEGGLSYIRGGGWAVSRKREVEVG